ncbi:TPA: hypothetical protein QDB19_004069 [Burkholderia vietnamiensis]|nr:hypothetical protein [Burkholderia vietnamiensis]
MELPIAIVHALPDPVRTASWMEQIQELFQNQPISAALRNHLAQFEYAIEREIAMRDDGSATDDECVALMTLRNYIGQCDAVIPKSQPYVASSPKPKAPRKPPMEPKPWQDTMSADEVQFCENAIADEIHRIEATCADNWRAARMWKSSQRRRFSKQREHGCCGSHDFVVKRWSWSKMRYDLYLLGFNYGH